MTLIDHPEPKAAAIEGSIVLFVSSGTDPHATCGALVRNLEEGKGVSLRCIGAGAVNQAIKSVAIARQNLARTNHDIVLAPSFATVTLEEAQRTAIVLEVQGY